MTEHWLERMHGAQGYCAVVGPSGTLCQREAGHEPDWHAWAGVAPAQGVWRDGDEAEVQWPEELA